MNEYHGDVIKLDNWIAKDDDGGYTIYFQEAIVLNADDALEIQLDPETGHPISALVHRKYFA